MLDLHVLVGQVLLQLQDLVLELPQLHVLLQLQVLQGRPHVVLAPPPQLVQLEVFQLPLVVHLALQQTVLVSELLDFPLHLVL